MININSSFTGCSINTTECRCFEKLTSEERKLVDDNSVNIKYNKREIICKQGAFVSQVLFVKTGLAKVFIEEGKNSLVLKIISAENFLGLASVSETHNTYQYSAMAYIETEVMQIDVNIFRRLLRENAEFSKSVIDILSANSIQIYGRFFCLTNKQSYGRLADIILCLANHVFKRKEFELPLSRKDLAELSGMSTETVIRILKKFKAEKIIDLQGKTVKVIDSEKLSQISVTG